MRKILIRTAVAVLALLLGIQFVPVERSNSVVQAEILAPPEIREILERSCYDCHSNTTRWPWYSRVAPVSWFVAKHVRKGREELNLTEWPLFDDDAQRYLLGEMKSEVKMGEMPLESYLLVHRNAVLDSDTRLELITWLDREVLLLSDY